jgi:hypothetical protein
LCSIDVGIVLQQPGLNVITELIIGYMYPGRPLANITFKTYGYISMSQAIMFLSDFKLGHYMKIPPKSMFVVQVNINLKLIRQSLSHDSLLDFPLSPH